MERTVEDSATKNFGSTAAAYEDSEPLVDYDLINEEEHQLVGDPQQNLLAVDDTTASLQSASNANCLSAAALEEAKDDAVVHG